MRPLIYAALAASSLLLSACESVPKTGVSPEPTYEQAQHNAFNAANYGAVAELLKRYPAAPATASNFSNSGGNAPFIVATLVNIDQLEQSSTLGRLISEQVASRMSQLGYGVLELKVRNGVYMKRNEGEFLLSREIREVAAAHNAQGVVVGTYAEGANLLHVTLKLVDPSSSLVLAAHDYTLPLNRQVKSLLRTR